VHISQPYASQVCTGNRKPAAEVQARIEVWTGGGVRMMDWQDAKGIARYRSPSIPVRIEVKS
jgi:DNA-binding transcriptional regulator YdaS (Cro superfamily)